MRRIDTAAFSPSSSEEGAGGWWRRFAIPSLCARCVPHRHHPLPPHLKRRGAAVAALLLLAGCQKSFDERYAEAQKTMASQAASIDQELAVKASEAAMGEAAVTPVVEASKPAK